MVNGPDRSWIGHRESAQSLTSGVRMFAYLALRENLTCAELAMALEDLESVMKMFDQPVHAVSAEAGTLVVDRASEAWWRLKAEKVARCKEG
jgi:hypothetical protein